jgi:bifunctional non-homologous end joining protein LigD
MTSTIPTTQSASLHFREGNSDKEYHAAIEPEGEGYIVTFSYGRRGTTLTTGTKTTHAVSIHEATKIFDKLIASKLAKGYQYSSASVGQEKPYQQSVDDGRDSGIRCQLLNAVDESELSRLLNNTTHCLQEKHDGRRLMVRKQGDTITGINRRGLIVAIPDAIREAVEHIPFDVLIDGEAVGETLHAFDLLEVKGVCLRKRRYIDRFTSLMMIIPPGHDTLRWVCTSVDPNDKMETYEELRSTNREGVVFKDMDARYNPGRPNSGGPQLKFKFVESASFVVTGINTKRSVTLGLYDGEKLVNAGNVSIPPNHAIPHVGNVVEARYLYAYRESGSIYQPVYLGRRDDILPTDCVIEQLKYKSETTAVAA